MRIFADRGGRLETIGLATGDLLVEVNGFPLTHPDALLAAYSALRRTNEPWLVVERDGRRMLVTYRILDR